MIFYNEIEPLRLKSELLLNLNFDSNIYVYAQASIYYKFINAELYLLNWKIR